MSGVDVIFARVFTPGISYIEQSDFRALSEEEKKKKKTDWIDFPQPPS